MKSSFWSVAILEAALSGASLPASFAHGENGAPRLVLQLTVDGLRADRLTRNIDHLGAGGFRYLLDSGAVFANAHYQHANTPTPKQWSDMRRWPPSSARHHRLRPRARCSRKSSRSFGALFEHCVQTSVHQ